MAIERRKDRRICASIRVQKVINGSTDFGLTKNISASGLYLITKEKLATGEKIKLRILYQHWDLMFAARVVHVHEEGAGLIFLKTNQAFSEQIQAIINQLLSIGAKHEDRRIKNRTLVGKDIVWEYEQLQLVSRLKDLSTSGAFIQSSQPIKIGTIVTLFLPRVDTKSPKDKDLGVEGCRAEVIHQDNDGFGVNFISPSQAFIDSIFSLLKAHIDGKSKLTPQEP